MTEPSLLPLLRQIAAALDRLAPADPPSAALDSAKAFIWHAEGSRLEAVDRVSRIELELLRGVDRNRDILLDNTRRFARGLPANNALLWGARGTGKSSLVKAVHAAVNAEGGIEGRPSNVIFYATSNRRHLMPRDMIENERSTAINPSEAVEEKVSLSDRFGLWLGFHNCDQDTYFAILEGYARRYGLKIPVETLRAEANEWSVTRGARSGRVACPFIQDLAGRLGKTLD